MSFDLLFHVWLATCASVGLDLILYGCAPAVLDRIAVLPSGILRTVTLPLERDPNGAHGLRTMASRPRAPKSEPVTVAEPLPRSLLDPARIPIIAVLSVARIRIHPDGARAHVHARLSPPWPLTLATVIGSSIALGITGVAGPAIAYVAAPAAIVLGLVVAQRAMARSLVVPVLERLADEAAS